jgi:hypothetical protein
MLLRISLIIAIVTGLGAVGLVHTKLKERITTITSERDTNAQDRDRFQQESKKAKDAERKAKEERDESNRQLSTATNDLITVTAKSTEQEKRANDLSGQLNSALKERNDAQTLLASWNALGIAPNQVEDIKTQLKSTTTEKEALTAENAIISQKNKRLSVELSRYTNGNQRVEMPGFRAKVAAVDPKWEFLVLDKGSNDGALERGEVLIAREGKLVAKARISSVETNRCIANIMPEWKKSDVLEGDQVLY